MAETERKIVVEFGGDPEQEERDLNWKGQDQKRKDTTGAKGSVLTFKNLIQGGYAYNLGRQVFTTVTGRIGQYTGNYMIQNQINNVLSGITIIGGIAGGVIAGNPIAVASAILQIGITAADFNQKITVANIEAEGIQKLTNISTALRSRGAGSRL
jgi:hypothetical protein